MILRLFSVLICVALTTTCYGSESSNSICADGAAAAKWENYERAMNIWAEGSIDASAKMRLKAVLECLASAGLAADQSDSAAWIVKRAKEGSVQAMLFAGLIYGSGIGVDADLVAASVWLDKAAARGSEAAAYIDNKLQTMGER